MTLGLDEALLKLEVATVEGCREVVSFEDDSIVANIIVEIDKLVCRRKAEGVLDKISLVALELHIWDFDVVYKAYDVIKDVVLGLTERAKVNRGVDTGVSATLTHSHRGKYCCECHQPCKNAESYHVN